MENPQVGDKVFLIYSSTIAFPELTAFQVEILTPFKKSDRFSRGQIVCKARYLKKFTFNEGWGPYTNPRGDVYRVDKKNLYPTWNEALQKLKENISTIVSFRKADIQRAEQEIELRKQNLKIYKSNLLDLQRKAPNIAKSFALIEDTYVSPFTGEKQ